jgi:hypothetical protein
MHRHAAHNSNWEFLDATALFSHGSISAMCSIPFWKLLVARLMRMQEVIDEQILQAIYVSIEEIND